MLLIECPMRVVPQRFLSSPIHEPCTVHAAHILLSEGIASTCVVQQSGCLTLSKQSLLQLVQHIRIETSASCRQGQAFQASNDLNMSRIYCEPKKKARGT